MAPPLKFIHLEEKYTLEAHNVAVWLSKNGGNKQYCHLDSNKAKGDMAFYICEGEIAFVTEWTLF